MHTLQLIRPKLDGFLTLSKQVVDLFFFCRGSLVLYCKIYKLYLSVKVSLIDVLKEIQAHDSEVSGYLTPEYKFILANADKLRATYKRQPSYLDRLYGNEKIMLLKVSTPIKL